MEKFIALTLTILFAANLIVTGIPVEKVETTTTPADDNSTDNNGTHKEL